MAITDLPQYTFGGVAYYCGPCIMHSRTMGQIVVDQAGTPQVAVYNNPTFRGNDTRKMNCVYCQNVATGAQIITDWDDFQRNFTLTTGNALAMNQNLAGQAQEDEDLLWKLKDLAPWNESVTKQSLTRVM